MKNISELTELEFSRKFDRLSMFNRYQLMRKYGFPMEDNHEQLRKKKALEVGLTASASATEIIYAIEKGGIGCACDGQENDLGAGNDCAAEMFPMSEINLDPKRFQNRTDAFSELSAESVAQNYDRNKFDPVVIWRDSKNNLVYMLSGHSRYEGMHRRGEDFIPARFFQGNEAAAIQFARIDANRAANAENLVEDLTAYQLMRDGNQERGIKKAKKNELERVFKGKAAKLEAWSHLNPAGMFIATLQQENRSEFPHIERLALWVGQIRKDNPEMTNTHENDCFNFFYAETKNLKLTRDEAFELIEKRLAWGKARLFPECDRGGCSDLQELSKRGPQADTYRTLENLRKDKEIISDRLRTTSRAARIYTEAERQKYLQLGQDIDKEIKRLQKNLNVVEAAPGLFGVYKLPQFNGQEWTLNGVEEIKLQEFKSANLPEIKISYTRKLMDDRKLTSSEDVANLLRDIWNKKLIDAQEEFVVLYLNTANKVIGFYKHTVGASAATLIDIKIVLAAGLKCIARGLVVAHNHPSGNLQPSSADLTMTKKIKEAGKLMDMELLDSLIITSEGYYSLADEGLL